jgi:Fur family ferric uptake transcriptional regulator
MENGHHHHLICSNCDRVIEFEDCLVEELARALGGRFDFKVQGHLIELYGVCQSCRE